MDNRINRLLNKSEARVKLEQKVKLIELTGSLDSDIEAAPPNQVTVIERPATKTKKTVALIVLIAVVAAAVLPLVGVGSIMLASTLTVYAYFALIGLIVVIGIALFIWSLLTLLRD